MEALPGTEMGTLRRATASLREALQTSDSISGSITSILDSFGRRVSALDEEMRPIREWPSTDSTGKANEGIDRTLESAAVVLGQFDLMKQADAKLLKVPSEDLDSYMEAMTLLRDILYFFTSNGSFKKSNEALDNVDHLIGKAMQQLEDDFEFQLSLISKTVEHDHLMHQAKSLEVDTCAPCTLSNLGTYTLLHNLALQLVSSGRQQQCLNIYREVRGSALEESLKRLGVESLPEDYIQKMELDELEAKIGVWIQAMRHAFKLLFAGERKMCDKVFEGIDTLRDHCFTEVTTNSVRILIRFGEAIAKGERSPQKLFVQLDMYEVMHELQSEIEKIFEIEACFKIRESVLSLMKCISRTINDILHDFEKAVEQDTPCPLRHDGSVHPITRYVIGYLKYLFDYQSTLKMIFQECEVDQTDSHLATVTKRILQALQSNLGLKSKQYEDASLSYLFHMNNIQYVLKSVKKSEIKCLLGEDWMRRNKMILQQSANQYIRLTLPKITSCLDISGLNQKERNVEHESGRSSFSRSTRKQLKERFKSFNMQLEKLIQKQNQWVIADAALRDYFRLLISGIIVSAYRTFVLNWGTEIKKLKNPAKYIKYSPEAIEFLLGSSFNGDTPKEDPQAESRSMRKEDPEAEFRESRDHASKMISF